MATLRFIVDANATSADRAFSEIGRRVTELDQRLRASRELSVGNRTAMAAIARTQLAADRLRERVSKPMDLSLRGAARAEAQLLELEATDDRLNKKLKDTSRIDLSKTFKGLSASPGLVGPALLAAAPATSILGVAAGATAGLGGAALAGASAMAAFGAVAKPVLSDALTASKAVEKAQTAYNSAISAGVPTAKARATLQAANARALQTYNAALKSGANPAKALAAYHATLAKNQQAYNAATSKGVYNAQAYRAEQIAISKAYAGMSPQQIALSKQLGQMADAWDNLKKAQTPLIAGALQPWLKGITSGLGLLGSILKPMGPVVHDLGVQFATLMDSSTMKSFMSWIGSMGSAVVKAAGSFLINFLTGVTFLLPQFTPLIKGAAAGLSNWGLAFVRWSASKKASDEITKFLGWFKSNGPLVSGLLRNLGGALKALAPGLGTGATTELNLISGFLGLIAKLPPGLAKPLLDVAGAMLILKKTGVLTVGIKLATLSTKGGTGAAASEAAGASPLLARLAPGLKWVVRGGIAIAAVEITSTLLTNTPSGSGTTTGPSGKQIPKNWWDNPFGMPGPGDKSSSNNWLTSWSPYIRFFKTTLPNAVSGAIGYISKNWPSIIATLQNPFTSLGTFLGTHFKTPIVNAFKGAGKWLQGVGSTIFGGLINGIVSDNKSLGSSINRNIIKPITGAFKGAGKWLKNTGYSIIQGLSDGILSAWSWVSGWFARIRGWIGGAFKGAGNWIKNTGYAIIQGLSNGILSAWGWVSGWFGRIKGWIGGAFKGAGNWIKNTGYSIIQGLSNGLLSAWSWVSGWFARIRGWIGGAFKGAGNWIKNQGYSIIQGLSSGLLSAWSWVSGWFARIRGWIGGAFKGAGIWLKNTGYSIIQGLSGGLQNAWGWVSGWFGRIKGWIGGAFKGTGVWLWNDGYWVISGLWNGMKAIWNKVTKWVSGIAGWIKLHKGPISLDSNLLVNAGKAIMNGFHVGLKDSFGHVMSFVSGVANSVGTVLSKGASGVASFFTDLFGGGGGISGAGVANSSAYAALKSAAAKMGWTGAQWNALNSVEMAEAGYNLTIRNPSSGAYGIAQGITGPSWYYGYGGNPNTAAGQAVAMVNYIHQRYGNPVNAWAHEQAYHWYGKGLVGGIFDRPTLIGVGEAGRERVDVTPLRGSAVGSDGVAAAPLIGTYNTNYYGTGDTAEAMNELLFTLRRARQAGFPRR